MTRETEIKIALLRKLSKTPSGYMTTQDHLINDVQLIVQPSPSRTEIESVLREMDSLRLVAGVMDDFDGEMRWRITPAGKVELSLR